MMTQPLHRKLQTKKNPRYTRIFFCLIFLPVLQSPFNITLCRLCHKILTLVIIVLATGKGQLQLRPPAGEVYLQGHKCKALFPCLAEQLDNLRFMQQKLPGPQRIVIEDVSLLIGTNVHVSYEYLSVFYFRVGIFQIRPACPKRLYLCAL